MHHASNSAGSAEPPSPADDLRTASLLAPLSHQPKRYRHRGHIKRSRSAPDCKHSDGKKIKIGVCAMDKKAGSKPMREIVARLLAFGEFEVFFFGDKVILQEPVEKWPSCDAMLSWHSDGFPLRKAQQYVALRQPFLVNDVMMQDALLDRRKVYRILMDNSIPVPRHVTVSRDALAAGETDPPGFTEGEDYVELHGVRIDKPFVEKPVSGEDHNIYIYYPYSMGGGVKRLFRKVVDKSADYDSKHPGTVRRDGSYIYEEFLTTGGTDVKVYTVGPRYAHAEARKSPVVDGKVNRTADGKEVRFPVLLSPQEKEIARMVCLAFGQRVCGFDLLRSEKGKSYVCDVNGWSFVKNSKKYYDDAAGIIRNMLMSQLAPHRLAAQPDPALWTFTLDEEGGSPPGAEASMKGVGSYLDLADADGMEESGMEDDASSSTINGDISSRWMELRCVLAVIRHGDRTPKQKMKMKVSQAPLLQLFSKYKDSKGKQAKLKSPAQLQELLDVTRELLVGLERRSTSGSDGASTDPTDEERDELEEQREKFRIVRTVLEQGGQFSGINRKVQLKPLKWGMPGAGNSSTTPEHSGNEHDGNVSAGSAGAGPGSSGGSGSRVPVVKELLLILKYGGVLTHAGRKQAEELGKQFRTKMYPTYGPAGGGLLRLHSTYRHDLKIYSSDEGRVQMSAAAFTKGLLDLEGSSLTPILVSLVTKNASMLDAFGKGASEDILNAKNVLYQHLTWDAEKATSLCSKLAPPLATPASTSPPQSPRVDIPSGAASAHATPFLTSPAQRALNARLGAIADGQHTPPDSEAPTPKAPASPSHHPCTQGSILLHTHSSSGFGNSVLQGTSSGGMPRHSSTASSTSDLRKVASSSGMVAAQEWRASQVASVANMPTNPLKLLHRLVELMKALVDQLREKCLEERPDAAGAVITAGGSTGAYSSLSQSPEEWNLEPGRPCSGERLLLMFDRWRKLLKSFFNEKKGQFDISKVPDIYDSAKYDTIHNAHLSLDCLVELYDVSRQLAAVIVPNEYGLEPAGKLRIGSKIASELVGKLLADLGSMQEESLATAALEQEAAAAREARAAARGSGASGPFAAASAMSAGSFDESGCDAFDMEFGRMSIEDGRMQPAWALLEGGGSHKKSSGGSRLAEEGAAEGAEGAAEGGAENEEEQPHEEEALHRLCPTYASDVNSPMRHVRTRIYYTSESHIHSLVNVLRYCHLQPGAAASQPAGGNGSGGGGSGSHISSPTTVAGGPLVGPEGQAVMSTVDECDYMTQIVFRMFEDKRKPIDHPERFIVEVLFSNGANHNPTEVLPLHQDHTLPLVPRAPLCSGQGSPLARMVELLSPCTQRKVAPSSYTLSIALRAPMSLPASNMPSRSPSIMHDDAPATPPVLSSEPVAAAAAKRQGKERQQQDKEQQEQQEPVAGQQ